MTKSITPGQIKKNNKQQIYNYIFRNRKASQLELAEALDLSRPTVATNLAELEKEGMICKSGLLDSDYVGRKATAYAPVPDARIAIGVEIVHNMVKIAAANLYGEKLKREVIEVDYCNEAAYYERICGRINAFIDSLPVPHEHVLGIGISLQGLVAPNGQVMLYGKILQCTGLTIDAFKKYLHFPCSFMHDPDAAAMSELWVSPEVKNAYYLSLSIHIGGSIIYDGRVLSGKHGHTSVFEHVRAIKGGERCYCGRKGCWDTLVSLYALLGEDDLDTFFARVRAGKIEEAKRWKRYLKHLARLIEDLHLVYDQDFILGGYLAPYIIEEDILYLYHEIRRICPFEDTDDFIRISKMPSHNITIGLALPYIRRFLQDIELEIGELLPPGDETGRTYLDYMVSPYRDMDLP